MNAIEGFELSPQQRRLWRLGARDGYGPYRSEVLVTLRGALDRDTLRRAFEELLGGNEILSVDFTVPSGVLLPLQVPQDPADFEMAEEDLRSVPEDERIDHLEARLAARRGTAWSVESGGPWLRAVLFDLGEHHHALFLETPALVADVLGVQNLVADLVQIYGALAEDREPAEPAVAYLDLAAWFEESLHSEEAEDGRRHWRQKELAGLESQRFAFERSGDAFIPKCVTVTRGTEQRVAELAARHGVTPAAFHLSCWLVLLSHLFDRDRLVIGVELDGRNYAELDAVVGPCARTVPFACAVNARRPFLELVQGIDGLLAEDQQWQECFAREAVDGEEEPSDPGIVFAWEAPCETFSAAGVDFEVERAHCWGERFRVKLVVAGGGRRLDLLYDAGCFTAEDVEPLVRSLMVLEEEALALPTTCLGALAALEPRESACISGPPRAAGARAGEASVVELFLEQVAERPEDPAVVDAECTLTYGELERRSRQLALHLRTLGVGIEIPVALLGMRSVHTLVAVLGVLRAGGAYLPLEPDFPRERLEEFIAHSGARVLIAPEPVPELASHLPQVVLTDPAVWAVEDDATLPQLRPESLAYVLYTSGSTGRPKAVGVEHLQLSNYVSGLLERYELAGTRCALVSTFAADLGNTVIYGALVGGGCLHIFDEDTTVHAEAFAERMQSAQIDTLKIVPSHFEALLSAEDPAQVIPQRYLVLGGEALPPRLVFRVRNLAPGCRVINHYGPTETTVGILTDEVQPEAEFSGVGVPLGRPLAENAVAVLGYDLQPVPIWAVGELYLGGKNVTRGYLGEASATAQRFLPNPFAEGLGGRMYRTGDRVRRLPHGDLVFVGRIDHQVKIRGFRVDPAEIEVALRARDEVQEAVVVVREDRPGEVRLVAYVVRSSGAGSDFDARAHLRRRLPEVMVPAAVVELAELPLTKNGKVDRRALPPPERARRTVAPRSERERVLVEIWGEVLGNPEVGVEDDFFELGGDSILSIQVVARAQRAGFQFTARDLFRQPTIAELVALARASAPEVPAEQALGELPLSPIQHWFFEDDPAEPNHFNQTLILRPTEPLDPETLSRALDVVAGAHAAFRLRFRREAKAWRQELVPEAAIGFDHRDLGDLEGRTWDAVLDEFLAAFERRHDLEAGPLMHAALLTSPLGDRLVLSAHHLIVDGVSWRILFDDLVSALGDLKARREPQTLPESTVLEDWALGWQAWATSAEGESAAEAWCRALGPDLPESPLPMDIPLVDPEVVNTIESVVEFRQVFDAEITAQVLRGALGSYRLRTDDLLITALVEALSEHSGATRLELELEGHGRGVDDSELDLSRAMGWFTTRYPVVLELPSHQRSLAETLLVVKEQLRSVPVPAAGYGAARYLGTGESAARLAARPHPTVCFNNLGRFDTALAADGPLRLASERSAHQRSPQGRRRQQLDVVVVVLEDRLEVSWLSSRALHREKTLKALSTTFRSRLEALVEHCTAPGTGGVTPSDFPLAALDQPALDRLFPSPSAARIEDVYPLSPLQEGMLFHTLRTSDGSTAYMSSSSCTFRGELEPDLFRRAWEAALERHGVLRTSFLWSAVDEPLQVVHRTLELPFQQLDWRDRGRDQQRSELAELERRRLREGFSLDEPPLFELLLIRLEDSAWRFLWFRHHLLLEGWSTTLLLDEVLTHYLALLRGATYRAPERRPFRDYIAWLRAQDLERAEEFWRQLLEGFRQPTPLRFESRPPATGGESGFAIRQHLLSADHQDRLTALARQHRLTLNTFGQGFWALLLAHQSGLGDLVFGSVGAGRPPELEGSGQMVGMFINTLPVRVAIDSGKPLAEWLHALQAQQAEQRLYEHTPLVRIQAVSEVPRQALFESFYVFENYPPTERVNELGGVEIEDADHFVRNSYPLTLRILPGEGLRLDLLHDVSRFREETVDRILSRVALLFEKAEELLEGDVAAALNLLSEADRSSQAEKQEAYDAAVAGKLRGRARRRVAVSRSSE